MERPILDDQFANEGPGLKSVEFAGIGVRIGAALVDVLILLPIYLISMYNTLNLKSIFLMVVLSLVGAAYKPFLERKKSATFGKLAVGIKLVDESLNPITGAQAIKRYFPWIISVLLSLMVSIQMYMHPGFKEVDQFIEIGTFMQGSTINSVNSIYGFVFLIIVGVLIVDSKKQGLHDKFAKTYCIHK